MTIKKLVRQLSKKVCPPFLPGVWRGAIEFAEKAEAPTHVCTR